jgi:hypothetical protein
LQEQCLTELEHATTVPLEARDALAALALGSDPGLSLRARALHLRAFGVDPGAPAPRAAESAAEAVPEGSPAGRPELPPGDPMRVIYSPTAFTRPTGRFGFNAFELGALTVDYGVSDNVELGAQTAIPLGFVAVGGLAKIGYSWNGGAIAVRGNVIVAKLLVDSGQAASVFGGGPVLTLGNYDNYFNISAQVYGASADGGTGGFALPNFGGSFRLGEVVRLGAELYFPTGLGEDSFLGEVVLLLWGIRLFGDHVWGDIALADPICDGCADIYQVIPLGIPFLNIGGSW